MSQERYTCCDGTPVIDVTPDVVPFPSLISTLVGQGYQFGWPSNVTRATRQADLESYKRQRCGNCHAGAQQFFPLNCGNTYVIVVRCRQCRHEEEC